MSGRVRGTAAASEAAGNGRGRTNHDGSQGPSVPLTDRLALSPAEAAQTVGVSESHLRSLLPEIPHVYLGRRVVIPVDSLRTWLKERAQTESGKVDRAVDEILDGLSSDRIKRVR